MADLSAAAWAAALAALERDGDDRALLAQVPYAQALGLRIRTTPQGRCYHMPYAEHLLGNPQRPSLHGGALAGFLESAALLEVIVRHAQRRVPKPVDFSIDYLRRATAAECVARVEVVREGRRAVLVRADCHQGRPENLVAQARVHLLLEAPE
ncbi:MAG: thioesterase [Gammaproteobacteria bacterium]|nr:MAG: thioesterase [Gammaproteobacteria bacterium]